MATDLIRDRVHAAASRLPEFMEARNVVKADREYLRNALQTSIGFSP